MLKFSAPRRLVNLRARLRDRGRGLRRRGRLRARVATAHPLEVFDAPGGDGGADQLVLPLQTLGEERLIEARRDEIGVGRALAREDRAADVDEREDEGRLQPLVFRLDVVDRPVVLDVCVEACDHVNFVGVTGTVRRSGRSQKPAGDARIDTSTALPRRSISLKLMALRPPGSCLTRPPL
jgi:hypothetical protein